MKASPHLRRITAAILLWLHGIRSNQKLRGIAIKVISTAAQLRPSRRSIAAWVDALDAQKALVALCFAFTFSVAVPNQSLELYRFAAQSAAESYASSWKDLQGVAETIKIVLAVCAVSVSLMLLAVLLQALYECRRSKKLENSYQCAIAGLAACIPPLAAAWGISRARVDASSGDLGQTLLRGATGSFLRDGSFVPPELTEMTVKLQLAVNSWISAAWVGLVLLALIALFVAVRYHPAAYKHLNAWRAAEKIFVSVALTLPIFISLAFLLSPVWLPRLITSFGLICLFFVVAAGCLGAISILQLRTRVPLLFFAILFAGIFSFWNDNHGIRELDESATAPHAATARTVGDAFGAWLAARRDRNDYDIYPVYLVAAEGGGMYAAFKAATFLASVQDACPRFAHHLFAISSVSGGSVGAVIFDGLLRKTNPAGAFGIASTPCGQANPAVPRLNLADVAESILRDDFLAPVLASFLFPDFLQRFIFVPIPALDRSIALEKSLEQSWDDETRPYRSSFKDSWIDGKNALREPFITVWRADSNSPALFINTTEVACGRGRVISPFSMRSTGLLSFPFTDSVAGGGAGLNMSISTAAVLSARFPWLTPPGWISLGRAPVQCGSASVRDVGRLYLVDGGYLDNSGVITALAIVSEIEKVIENLDQRARIQINLIVLTSADFSNPSVILSDYLAPFQTLLSTREARGAIAIEHAELKFSGESVVSDAKKPVRSIVKSSLQGFGYPLPLGWRLSPITRLSILGQNGDATQCRQQPTGPVERADCVQAQIINTLSNR